MDLYGSQICTGVRDQMVPGETDDVSSLLSIQYTLNIKVIGQLNTWMPLTGSAAGVLLMLVGFYSNC